MSTQFIIYASNKASIAIPPQSFFQTPYSFLKENRTYSSRPHLTHNSPTDPQHKDLILFKGKPYLWLANPPMARDKPTNPQPRVKVKLNRANSVGKAWWHPNKNSPTDPQHWGLFLSKGKPYLWFVTHPWLATNQPIPNIGVSVNIDGA